MFLAPNRHQKNFSQTFESPRVTLPDVAFPLPDIAALCLSSLIRCISLHYPSLPLHIGAAHLLARSRLTFSFHSIPMQCLSHASRPFTFPLLCRASICTAFPLRTRASPRGSMPLLCHATHFHAIPMHRQSTRRLAFPLHNPTIRYCTMPLLIFASPCSAFPLQRLDTLYTVPLHCGTSRGLAFAWLLASQLILCIPQQ